MPIHGKGSIYNHFFLLSQKAPIHISYHANSNDTFMILWLYLNQFYLSGLLIRLGHNQYTVA
jgi:hypothetical protein